MSTELVLIPPRFAFLLHRWLSCSLMVPAPISRAGSAATRRFLEFFTANIRNPNTRAAYSVAVQRFFSWCDKHGWTSEQLEPMHLAAYVELLGVDLAAQPALTRRSVNMLPCHFFVPATATAN